MPKREVCNTCGSSHNIKQCMRCKAACYCSVKCQRQAWRDGHRFLCKETSKDKPAVDAPEPIAHDCNKSELQLQSVLLASFQDAFQRAAQQNAAVGEHVLTSVKGPSSIAVMVTEFSQDGKWFVKALLESPELEAMRPSPAPESGPKIFIQPPCVREAVVQFLHEQGWNLKPRHVVTRVEDQELVVKVVGEAQKRTKRSDRGGSTCKVKVETELSIPVDSGTHDLVQAETATDAFEVAYPVKNTMVHVPIPSSMYSALSTRAATI